MKELKILNLYACLGGNRLKWEEVNPNIKVTAVELDEHLAELYQERFPNDEIIVGDAHKYLIDNFRNFDIIWGSPPCPSHSRARFWGFGKNGKSTIYPDLTLYQEIILLSTHFEGVFIVENVIPYYTPLIEAQEVGRHLFWANFKIPKNIKHRIFKGMGKSKNELDSLCDFHKYDFKKYKGSQKVLKIARNLVDFEAGKSIFKLALNHYTKNTFLKANKSKDFNIFEKPKQETLF